MHKELLMKIIAAKWFSLGGEKWKKIMHINFAIERQG